MTGAGADLEKLLVYRDDLRGVRIFRCTDRVRFDGSAVTLLSPEPGNHTVRPVPRAP